LVAAWLWSSTDVVVGRDGIRLRHFFTRFIPHEDIDRVEIATHDDRLRVILRDGRAVPTHPIATGQIERMRALAGYVQRAMTLEEGPSVAAIQMLDRGDEDLSDWRRRLRDLFDVEPGYRGPRLNRSDAAAVIDDPGRSAERRLGAALALVEAGLLDDGGRRRLRVAAEASANPKLRVAFERLAEGQVEDAAIEEALGVAPHSGAGARGVASRGRG
jgi:hypothetical protein